MSACVLVSVRVAVDPAAAFDIFTADIDRWWRPDGLFQITPQGDGALSFEGGEGGRLVTRIAAEKVYEIGRISAWRPGERLAFDWRPANVSADMKTRVEVDFEQVGAETRVTVRHSGWTGIPGDHAARHGFPDRITLMRAGDWWRRSLGALQQQCVYK